jgi:5-formaminoimidazole-4-carboxamide-1-(beta)-D-ribofuranosyl 5'-monophosphate synthetase
MDLSHYDLDRLAVSTIASHTALQILRGAKKYGFRTIAVAGRRDTAEFYRQFPSSTRCGRRTSRTLDT